MAISLLTIFLSSASWAWDEFIEPQRQGLPRPKVIQLMQYVPWYGWLIIGLTVLTIVIGEHAFKLIVAAEARAEEAEAKIYDGRPLFVLNVSRMGTHWLLNLKNVGARSARYIVMESKTSNQGNYHLRFGQILALPPNEQEHMPYAVMDKSFNDVKDPSAMLKFLCDNEMHANPLEDAVLTWWDIGIKFRDTDESVKDGGIVRLCYEVKDQILYGTAAPYTERNFKPLS